MSELEICPNLKPQTGSTGGGDSKVDASTYPVSPALVERCYWGSPNLPSNENWAFAFSCKKNWKGKATEDIKKIAGIEQKFAKVFFISSQYIRDKIRAKTELDLSNQYGFEVHILDRTWIIKTVIEHKREEIAIEILNIGVGKIEKPRLGPRDTSRQERVDILLKKIGQPEIYLGNDYALAEDYLQAAILVRNLGKPRHEIDGLFTRSRSLAQKHGYRGQIIRCGYHHAWTTFWWFDDISTFQEIYTEMEKHLPGTDNAEDCELFYNLWLLLCGATKSAGYSEEMARLNPRLASIRAEVNRLAGEKDRPNNSLHAETLSYLLELSEGFGDASKAKHAFNGLTRCLKQSVGLGTYPAMQFINNLMDLGNIFGDLPGYDLLFDEMCQTVRNRKGETSEGKLLFERGIQLIDKDKPKDVLRLLGQARIRLSKEETLKESIWAALGCCNAYREMGLYWAARIEALIAAHTALRTKDSLYEFPIEGFLAAKNMAWLEMTLARIGPFIAWHHLCWLIIAQLKSMQYEVEKFAEELRIQEGVLGCFFLNLDSSDLKELSDLQYGLDYANLSMARWALLYGLGEFEKLVEELPQELAANKEKFDEYFLKWKNQPASEQLSKVLTGETRSYWNYESTIMGVTYRLKARNYLGPILFSENLLGIIEAALSLARWENLAFIVEEVNFLIDIKESGKNPPNLDLEAPPDPRGYQFLWLPGMLKWLNETDRAEVTDFLMQFLLKLLMDITIDPFDDLKQELDTWHKEDTFSRALGSSPTSIAIMDIIGKEPYELGYWCNTTAPSEI